MFNFSYYNFYERDMNYTYMDYGLTFGEFWVSSKEYTIQRFIGLYIPPIFIVIGTCGNAVAFFVLTRKSVRHTSICFYMATLALLNTIVLYLGCGLDWVSNVSSRPYIANLADWVCRLWQFVFNVIIYSTHWVVVAMVIDRYILMWHPSKSLTICTVFVAKLVMIIITVGLVTISIHAMWTYELTEHGCFIDNSAHFFQRVAWPWITATLYSYVPILLILLFSILIIISTFKTGSRANHDIQQEKLTCCTLVVSLTFLCLSLPTVLLNIIQYSRPDLTEEYHQLARMYLARAICQTIACFNYSITFVLYFLAVPSFRMEISCRLTRCRGTRIPISQEMPTLDRINRNTIILKDQGENKHGITIL